MLTKNHMKKILPLPALMTTLLLSACIDTKPNVPVAAQSDNSNCAILNVAVKDNTMTVSLTNTTRWTVEVDGEMEILFDYVFVGEKGAPEYLGAKYSGKALSERLVKLAPGETVTKVFKSGDLFHRYQSATGISVDGRTHLSEHWVETYRLPDFSRLDGVAVIYADGGSQSGVPGDLAEEENIPTPTDMLHAAVSAEVRMTNQYVFPLPPARLKGDKDLPHFK